MARIDNSINSPESFQILECLNEDCRFRFPRNSGAMSVNRCPKCRHEVRLAADLAFAQELPDSPQPSRPLPIQQAILDNIRSAWNVGSMFRTADGLGIRHLTLCGITPTPENPAVAKTSLGAEKSVAWRHFNNSLLASKEILASGTRLWALDQAGSVDIEATEAVLFDRHLGEICEKRMTRWIQW